MKKNLLNVMKKMSKKLKVFLLFSVFFCCSVVAEKSGVTFYAGFDNETPQATGIEYSDIQVKGGELAFGQGIKGKALLAGGSNGYISYPAKEVIEPLYGSVEFWFKAVNWDQTHQAHHALFETIGKGWILFYKYFREPDFFYLMSKHRKVNSRCETLLDPDKMDKWQHVVITWSPEKAVTYINGVETAHLTRPPLNEEKYERFLFGDRRTLSIDTPSDKLDDKQTLMDELYIYSRPLNKKEVKWAYKNKHTRSAGHDIPLKTRHSLFPESFAEPIFISIYPYPSQKRIMTKIYIDPRISDDIYKGTIELTPKSESEAMEISVTDGRWQGNLHYFNLAPGKYKVKVNLQSSKGEIISSVSREMTVTKPDWKDTTIGKSAYPPRPWTPIELTEDKGQEKIACWGREYEFKKENIFPHQLKSQGTDILAKPIALNMSQGGKNVDWRVEDSRLIEINPNENMQAGTAVSNIGRLKWTREMEYDGLVIYDLELEPASESVLLENLELRFSLRPEIVELWHLWADLYYVRDGFVPEGQGAVFEHPWGNYWWLGNPQEGLLAFCESDQAWPEYPHPYGFKIERNEKSVDIVWTFINSPMKLEKNWNFKFAFQATPVKKMPDDYRRWRLWPVESNAEIKLVWPNPEREKYYGYIVPKNVHEYRSFVEENQQQGLSFVPYSLLNSLSEEVPEWSFYGQEWFAGNVYQDNTDAGKFDMACLMHCFSTEDFVDFMVWSNNNFVKNLNLDGLYHDFSWAKPTSAAPEKGFGYYRDGQLRTVTPILAIREYYKRIYTMLANHEKKSGKKTYMITHTSYPLHIPIGSFSDTYVIGEQFIGKLKDNYLDVAPLDIWRSQFMGHTYGIPGMLLPAFRAHAGDVNYPTAKEPTLRMMGAVILHDMLLWPSWCNRDVVNEVFKAVDSAGILEAEFLPYWNNQNIIKGQTDKVKCSAFIRPQGGVILCILNTVREDVQVNLDLDCSALKCSKNGQAQDVLNDKKYELKNGSLEFTLAELKPKFLLIN